MTVLSDKLREIVNQRVNKIGETGKSRASSVYGIISKKVDHEMTVSFPIQNRPENQILQLRQKVFGNDQEINRLRTVLAKEEGKKRKIKKMILQLNSLIENQRESTKGRLLESDTLTKFRELIEEQSSFLTTSGSVPVKVQALNSRISSLTKEIEEMKKGIASTESSDASRELKRLKGKCKYLQKKCDETETFVRIEVECEIREDEEHISQLSRDIERAEHELSCSKAQLDQQRKAQKEKELKAIFNRIQIAKEKLELKDAEILQLQVERAQVESATELQDQKIERLEKELIALQKVTQ